MSNLYQFLSVSSTATTSSNITVAIGNQSVLASNVNRKGATIFSDGATGNLKLGSTASATSFTVKLTDQAYYEVPYNYTGAIDFYSAAATGTLRVVEFT